MAEEMVRGDLQGKVITYEEIAAIMNEEIQDKKLKEFLFRMINIKKSGITGIGVMYKMLMFAFLFANAKYKHDLEHKRNVRTSPNAIRAAEAFDCLYNGEDVSLDLVIYLLTEMQLDVACDGSSAYYASIFSGDKDATQVPIYRGLIKTWLRSADYVERNEAVLSNLLYGLYRALDVLRNVELRETSAEIVNDQEIIMYDFYYIPTKEVISGYGLMKNIEEDFYYLESYEVITNQKKVRLVYSIVDGKMEHIDTIDLSDFSQKMKQRLYGAPKSIFAKSLYSLDFKYIKNLALAVSDVITLEMKKKINAHFSLRYSDVFELGYKGFKDINWDNVLTILMFEEGPSNILEFVLDSDGFCFERVLKNLEIRYNDKGFSTRAKQFYDEEQRKEMDVLKNHTEINASFVKNMIEINKILMAKAIVNELAALENNKKASNACFVESLPMRIKNLNDVMNSQDSISAKVLEANRALEKTFRYIIPFYYGVIEYNKAKDKLEAEWSCRGERLSEEQEKQQIYAAGEKAFKKRALEVAKEVARKPLGELVRSFRELVESLIEKKGHIVTITENGKNLKEAIGRSSLCAKDVFEDILKIDTDGMLEEYAPKNCDIVSYINNVKHSKKGGTAANIILFNKFWMAVKEIFYFFIYNEDYRREMLLGQQISYDPIYPYVVQYEEKSERRDCCNISSFSVYLTEDNGKKEIKILSEREYTINEKYYCIPNVTTSNSRWWIDPFMINCREYDQLIADAMDDKKLRERQMLEDD